MRCHLRIRAKASRFATSGSLAALLLIPFLGCKTKSILSAKEPTVLMDDWWNVDYAKQVCASKLQNHTDICIDDPTGEVRDYESQIETTFAADPNCHGLKMIGTNGPVFAHGTINADWQMMLDYVPGDSKQNWTLTDRVAIVATGTDDAKATVHTLCAVLSHKGGSVE
jgi:hypothetical protein